MVKVTRSTLIHTDQFQLGLSTVVHIPFRTRGSHLMLFKVWIKGQDQMLDIAVQLVKKLTE